jgi:hypothetical protein
VLRRCGPPGWLGVDLDERTGDGEVAELLEDSNWSDWAIAIDFLDISGLRIA